MIAAAELVRLAATRVRDAEVLFRAKRYDGAYYICGYAVELALKARICKTLKWPGFPESNSEFRDYQSFKTHTLPVLLHLSGRETKIKGTHLTEWSVVAAWTPDLRYRIAGTATAHDTQVMIRAARAILKHL
ncbi:MAG TPA: HEPN domain-containing protein [Thermoanaerobaculia bacterium]